MQDATRDFLSRGLTGMHVLEIGAWMGKMSAFFALLGAKVTGVDIDHDYTTRAREEAANWGVEDRMNFKVYDGDPPILPDNTYDLVFLNSALLYQNDLEGLLRTLPHKMLKGGRVLFLENTLIGVLDEFFRSLAHLLRGEQNYHYITEARIIAMERVLDLRVKILRKNAFQCLNPSRTPRWWLLAGQKRA